MLILRLYNLFLAMSTLQKFKSTILRYAIEKFDEDVRQGFLKGTIGDF